MVTLKNDFLVAKFSEKGAELKSLVCNGEEQIWCGDEKVWGKSCPVLFPICGGLKDDKYILNGKEYFLDKHGYARTSMFSVEKADEDSVTFLLCSNEETKKVFPFEYELRIIYTLKGKTLSAEYNVKNLSYDTMYFSIGSHEGYATPEGIEDYDIIFPQKETLSSIATCGKILDDKESIVLKDSNVLPLYEKDFLNDALVFKKINSKSVNLRNRKTGREIQVDFPNSPYLLLWQVPGAKYICIEPWNGFPDDVNSDYNFAKKEGINAIKPGGIFSAVHKITIVKTTNE